MARQKVTGPVTSLRIIPRSLSEKAEEISVITEDKERASAAIANTHSRHEAATKLK